MIEKIYYEAIEISKIVDGNLVGNNCKISSISINSKDRGKDVCFFAVVGEKFDGHSFVDEAIENGATLIISEKPLNVSVSVIYVNDTTKALGMLGKHHKRGTRVIGVTGSVGKTTVKNMIISVLGEKFDVCGTEKNYKIGRASCRERVL